MLPKDIQLWLSQQLNATPESIEPVAGGCINQCYSVQLSNGERYFVKYHPKQAMFAAEAAGLSAINEAVAGFAPTVVAQCEHALVLQWLQPLSANKNYWRALAEQLALLHSHTDSTFGFSVDNFCGLTPQPNLAYADGYSFFAEQRLQYQAKKAFDAGKLTQTDIKRLEALCQRLPELVPVQDAALIHGDLWSGNVMNTALGAKVFDPACYFGWPEAELAMTTLFGGFDQSFYQTYQSVSNIGCDWRERAPLYNLYHLLNHLNLFGGSYLSSVREILNRF